MPPQFVRNIEDCGEFAGGSLGMCFAARRNALGDSPMTPIFSIAGCVLLFVGLCAAVVNLAKDDTSVRR